VIHYEPKGDPVEWCDCGNFSGSHCRPAHCGRPRVVDLEPDPLASRPMDVVWLIAALVAVAMVLIFTFGHP